MTSSSDPNQVPTGGAGSAGSARDESLNDLLNQHFAGRVVRKDLTKLVKEGANVPVYVLEYLLGNYCASRQRPDGHGGG